VDRRGRTSAEAAGQPIWKGLRARVGGWVSGGGPVEEELGAERAEVARLRSRVAELESEVAARDVEVERLSAAHAEEKARLSAELAALRQEVAGLRKENKGLRRRLAQAQRASKRPAPRYPRRKRKANPRKPGRKQGHPAAQRAIPDAVDEEFDVPLVGACPYCGGDVDEEGTQEQYEVDAPPVRPRWRKFINHTGHCKKCRRRVTSRHPEQTSTANGAACVTLGPRVLGLSSEMKDRLGVPYRKVARVLALAFEFPVSAGGLARAEQRLAKRGEATYERLCGYLRESAVVHVDETGWYITTASKKPWLWVFATPEGVTVYAIRESRGGDVPREILGDSLDRTLVVDGWIVYTKLGCRLGQCVAHLLRRCAVLLDVQSGDAASFPQRVKSLLKAALMLRTARDLATDPVDERIWEAAVTYQERKLAQLLGPTQTDPDNERFRKHLARHRDEILLFLRDLAVAPTNNLAEQETRPAVVVRKISAGNRTAAGARTHEILATLARTAERGGQSYFDMVAELLTSDGPIALPPERFGLPPHLKTASHAREIAHAPEPPCPPLRRQGRRVRRVDRAHPPTAPP
jgi:transposase